MKKYLNLSLVALVALMSCQKEGLLNETAAGGPIVFTASIVQGDSKATVEIDGSKAKVLWESTDRITVSDGNRTAIYKVSSGAGTKTATFVKDSGPDLVFPATYTASFGEALSTRSSQKYSGETVPVYMTAPSTTDKDNLCFSVHGGVLKLTLTKSGESARKIVISNATGSYTLASTSPVDLTSGATFYINLPAGTYTRMAVYDGNCKVAERDGLSFVIKENTLLPASTGNLTFTTIEDVLPGVFTVDRNGNWVHFSKGNLQYQAGDGIVSNPTWRFAENQYDRIGNNSSNMKANDREIQDGWIDLFGWGATGHNPYGEPPYSTSDDNVYKTVEIPMENETLTRENGGDWGVCMGEWWRTLSGGENGEWKYLFNTRNAATIGSVENVRYAKACLKEVDAAEEAAGVPGVILFPDNFVLPTNILFGEAEEENKIVEASFNNETASFEAMKFDASNWGCLESAGCVFLPVGGRREILGVDGADLPEPFGFYWSSTGYIMYETHAYYLIMENNRVNPAEFKARPTGMSVRLVTE